MSEAQQIIRGAFIKGPPSLPWILFRGLATFLVAALPSVGPLVHLGLNGHVGLKRDESPPKLALLVGIDHYAPGRTSPPALTGCANDVARMHAVLLERFGFAEEGIRILLNEDATHEAIVRSFDEHLLQNAKAGSKVLVYISGHGSRIPDSSGVRSAEPDGYDSTFLAYDSRADELGGERDVTDDELRSLLTSLTQITDQVVVITDTCHSGGVLRGGQSARSAPPGKNVLDQAWLREFWPKEVPLIEDGPGVGLDQARYVHVAAAERDQLAWELELPGVAGEIEYHGAMTYFLVEALDRATPQTTWREVIDDTAVRVAVQRFQTVNHLGNVDREIFGGDFRAVRGFKAQAKGNSLLVRAGAMVGLRVDSVLEVSDSAGTQLGQAKVVRVTPSAARAEWIEAAPDPPPEGALRVLEISRGSGAPPLRVRLQLETCTLPADPSFLHVVGDSEPAEYVLEERDDGLHLRTIEGLELNAEPIPKGDGLRDALENAAREEARWRALCELTAERGQRPINISIRTATAAEADGYKKYEPALEQPLPDGFAPKASLRLLAGFEPHGDFPSQSLVMMELENPYDVDLFVSVLSIEESREISLIFPKADKSVLLSAGESRTCPISILARESWSLDRFMQDRYLAIASDKSFDLSQYQRKKDSRGRAEVAPEALAPELLNQILTGPLTRGAGTKVSFRGWGISTANILVKMPTREK